MENTHHWVQTAQSRTNSQASETRLGDGRVDDPSLAEPVQKSLCDLVCTIVLGDLLTEDVDSVISLELLDEGLVQRITDSVLLGARGGVCSGLEEGGGWSRYP